MSNNGVMIQTTSNIFKLDRFIYNNLIGRQARVNLIRQIKFPPRKGAAYISLKHEYADGDPA